MSGSVTTAPERFHNKEGFFFLNQLKTFHYALEEKKIDNNSEMIAREYKRNWLINEKNVR